MTPIPRDPFPDSILALLADGYTFMAKRRRRLGSDTFATRLILRKATCIVGEDAAELFYGGDRFTRKGAMPPTTMRLLQDKGSVQQLDGLAHHHRKQMFMSLMTPGSIQKLVDAMVEQWRSRIRSWESMDEVDLHHEVQGCFVERSAHGLAFRSPSGRPRSAPGNSPRWSTALGLSVPEWSRE